MSFPPKSPSASTVINTHRLFWIAESLQDSLFGPFNRLCIQIDRSLRQSPDKGRSRFRASQSHITAVHFRQTWNRKLRMRRNLCRKFRLWVVRLVNKNTDLMRIVPIGEGIDSFP